VFAGDNAQGKSNLLEAIHVLATTKSLRAATDRELIGWRALQEETPFARLEARIGREGGELHIELLLRAEAADATRNGGVERPRLNGTGSGTGKTITVNGLPSKAAQLVGQANVVLFSPEDVALAAGPPAGRRRYLDITGSQVNPRYLRALQRYNRLLIQRNSLLRQVRERRQARDQLASWNEEQVLLGTQVLLQRLRMVDAINAVVANRFRELSGTQQQLEIVYSLSSQPGSPAAWLAARSEPALAEAFHARLAEVATREVEQAVSLVGPHRDDFAFLLDGMDVNTFGSRGQQRLVVLALKLAEAEFMRAESGENPILLLDDVLSELDPLRRELVLDRATSGAGQTLITTTNLGDLTPDCLARADLFRVEAGRITPTAAREPGARSQESGRLGDGSV
jgi:DNA replication and repair protein RecF